MKKIKTGFSTRPTAFTEAPAGAPQVISNPKQAFNTLTGQIQPGPKMSFPKIRKYLKRS